ncbi:TonB family protein [Serratia sp. NPDC087055]|uniref:TonB family protein n=1 Tax=Serratia sp. NPDC087055 TaxID=3364516 RepID=UPI00384F845B
MDRFIGRLCAALFCLAAFQVQAMESCTTNKQGNPPHKLSVDLSAVPEPALQTNTEPGYRVLCFDVDAAGKVQNIRVMEAQSEREFDNEVFIAMSKWRFQANKPFKDHRITVRFSRDEKAKVRLSAVPFR